MSATQDAPSIVAQGRRYLSGWQKVTVLAVIAVVVGLLVLIFSGNFSLISRKKEPPPVAITYGGESYTPPPMANEPPKQFAALPAPRPIAAPLGSEPGAAARQAELGAFQAAAAEPHGSGQAVAPRDDADGADDTALGKELRPTRLDGVRARRLPHPEFTIAQGTVIPCTQQTAFDTSYPGFVTAVIPHDIYGSAGHMILLDKGTKIFGSIEHGMVDGLARAFVLWRQATTPGHVRIELDSPAADEVGKGGLEGDINRHIWQKVGGVLAISFVQGAVQAGVNAAQNQHSGNDVNFYQFGSGVDSAADLMLRSTITIPDTLSRDQGLTCSVFVARDLDFSAVYDIKGHS